MARTKRIPSVWKSRLEFKPSKLDGDLGRIYCVIYADTYRHSHFPVNIVISKKEWENYMSLNYFYQTMMPTLGIHYYQFADIMDKVIDTAEASNMKNAKQNIQKLMMQMCTMKM